MIQLDDPISTSKTSAPGPYLGYGLQPIRLCHHILNAPLDARVSLELIDDVGVHYANGRIVREQTKSALSHNPLSDWSIDLWKTLANWADELAASPRSSSLVEFRLYVTPSKTMGSFAKAFDKASDSSAAVAAMENARKKYNARAAKPASSEHIDRFYAHTETIRSAVICATTIQCSDSDPVQSIRDHMSTFVQPEQLDNVSAALVGIFKDRAEACLRQSNAAILSVSECRAAIRSFLSRFSIPGYLNSINYTPLADELEGVVASRPIFVKQLELVELDKPDILSAVDDYLRMTANRTHWSEMGLILRSDVDEWDAELTKQHTFKAKLVEVTAADPCPIKRGQFLYFSCGDVQTKLAGYEVPGHFVRGSFGSLADQMKIGWHKDYKTQLKL